MSRLYMNAGRAVDVVLNGQSLKGYCSRVRIGKEEYALACETIKYVDVINILFARCGINASVLEVRTLGMLYVYTYERLFGKGKIQGGGAIKRSLMNHESELRRHLVLLQDERGVSDHVQLIDKQYQEHAQMPTYIRINTLRTTASQAIQKLFELYPLATADTHIPNLYAIPPPSKGISELPEVKSGIFIIQDKASCMPSQLLFDAWKGGNIIDSCAAPGNKTSHLAALVAQSNIPGKKKPVTITAFDKSETRWNLLRNRIDQAGANNIVTCINEDFLSLDVNSPQYSNVKAILVDPSCSGSGVVRALDRVYERVNTPNKSGDVDSVERIQNLRNFQVRAVRKAMSFPAISAVVYSTCSVNEDENESVVCEVLNAERELLKENLVTLRKGYYWKLVEPNRMSTWPRRGVSYDGLSAEECNCLIRCDPKDGLNGFFVAVFEKVSINNIQKVGDKLQSNIISSDLVSTSSSDVVVALAAVADERICKIDSDRRAETDLSRSNIITMQSNVDKMVAETAVGSRSKENKTLKRKLKSTTWKSLSKRFKF